jgi:hypothetical protein
VAQQTADSEQVDSTFEESAPILASEVVEGESGDSGSTTGARPRDLDGVLLFADLVAEYAGIRLVLLAVRPMLPHLKDRSETRTDGHRACGIGLGDFGWQHKDSRLSLGGRLDILPLKRQQFLLAASSIDERLLSPEPRLPETVRYYLDEIEH